MMGVGAKRALGLYRKLCTKAAIKWKALHVALCICACGKGLRGTDREFVCVFGHDAIQIVHLGRAS